MNSIPKSCDVVIIGGGPAGSLAGTYLSQKGYDVVLLEKQKHPRPHVGENIIPHFWKYCDLANVSDRIAKEGFIEKAGGTVAWKGKIRQMSFKDFGYTRPAYHAERDRFDFILLSNARDVGVNVFERTTVQTVSLSEKAGDSQAVQYRTADKQSGSIRCKFVVDASGQASVIGRQLGTRSVDQDFRFLSMWGYFDDAKYIGADSKIYGFEKLSEVAPSTFVSSIQETNDQGWCWHIPLRKHTSVGLIMPLEYIKNHRAQDEPLEEYFVKTCHKVPVLRDLLEPATYCEGSFAKIQDYSSRSSQLAGPGFFQIGDSAGFIDPIFSVGVVLGMYSAYIAAWAIDRCIQNPEATERTQAIFTDQMESRLEVSRSLALPQYSTNLDVSELAKKAVQFERSMEQELMDVVSKMTTRSENYQNLVDTETGGVITSERYRVLESIS